MVASGPPIHQSGTKPNLVARIWLPTLVAPKLVANISSKFHHLVNTGLAVGSLVKWLPIKVATPANYTQFEWFITRRLEMAPSDYINPGYFTLAAIALKPQQIPMFYIFPLEFGGVGNLHTHQNIRVLC